MTKLAWRSLQWLFVVFAAGGTESESDGVTASAARRAGEYSAATAGGTGIFGAKRTRVRAKYWVLTVLHSGLCFSERLSRNTLGLYLLYLYVRRATGHRSHRSGIHQRVVAKMSVHSAVNEFRNNKKKQL